MNLVPPPARGTRTDLPHRSTPARGASSTKCPASRAWSTTPPASRRWRSSGS